MSFADIASGSLLQTFFYLHAPTHFVTTHTHKGRVTSLFDR